ncbi:uncharacterized protein LOC122017309 [Zingiber officinale]|uniref:PUB 62/63 C-terminal domain-containing protein n=1 Tax=Zingiber officinale TaxID=94328 RepID=A0A8J5F969_ZINOF|nr:uncharacterized protein LOC122017309 [Zingiber officinale]KAG6481205.1 hypothetical protein ZIOFF_057801 [Zingiber officinale]
MNGGRVVQMFSSSMAPAPQSQPPLPPPLSLHSHPSSSLSLGLHPLPLLPAPAARHPSGHDSVEHVAPPVAKVKLEDIVPFEGVADGVYSKAVEELSGSLMRHNAVLIELGSDEAVILKCALDSARTCFKARAMCNGVGVGVHVCGKSGKGVYTYRAGRTLEDGDLTPACMGDAFRCMGKAARAALCAVARHLRLRSDVFNHLLDDTPLPATEVSSSVLIASCSQASYCNGKDQVGGGKSSITEVEKGFLTLIASDSPGIQVCDPNDRWFLADGSSGPGNLLLLTGRALSHATAGLRPAASYRMVPECFPSTISRGRSSLTFKLMPQRNAILDCSPIAAAGHVIPQSYQPILASQLMDDLSTEDDLMCNYPDNVYETQTDLIKEPSLRSILSDPLSGAFLEDAMVVSCGHSFGGHMLKKVIEMARCNICNEEIEADTLVPNYALQAAASTVKLEDDRKLFHNATLRKRRKEVGEQMEAVKRLSKDNGEIATEYDSTRHLKGVQYPFVVNEKVLIKGNKRTPDKFVGREAIVTSQCLNGWYLLKILGSGESVRLQYRSLQKLRSSHRDDRAQSQPLMKNSS